MTGATRILGVDPGTRIVGYGLLDHQIGARPVYIECGVIRLRAEDPMAVRLSVLARTIAELIVEFGPRVLSLEAAFHGVNASSALKLGQARGAVMAVAAERGLEVAEYPPAYVKRAVVGHGRASKQDVMARMQLLFNLARAPTADAADALAIALCHAHAPKLPRRTGP
ncbi:crossover junction endodeoxyribonuclease RuvC [Nannocystis bainbridge]|uniref:Crossover junction endodeoxyribonuclease RuvC n=1 Tax=Nannocystis bainbridge TaxID=2995303 RepID=A0ABT5DP35_9BACT|nr:crossover junction endodeoxyribonuclease RuvC [Nannocystis bainbridge]MDC0715407.1 crossover junction endodeoxyribonuclease RuvC [Nannocystis bainbridge]